MAAPVTAFLPIRPHGSARRNNALPTGSKIAHLSGNHLVHARLRGRQYISGSRA